MIIFMNETTKKIYEAFGYNTSKPLRKLSEITNEEALTIAKIFDNKKRWEVYQKEKDGQIGLKSNIFKIRAFYNGFESGPPTVESYEEIYFRSDGDISGPSFASQESYQLVNQYLFSIGIKRPILTKEKLESILLKKKKPKAQADSAR